MFGFFFRQPFSFQIGLQAEMIDSQLLLHHFCANLI
jgi:hypothetical protein